MPATTELNLTRSPIPGLLVLRLPVHGDSRGWFKENWQRAKMTALGLPDFAPVQHSVAHSRPVGTTRGIHAEPWDKLVSIASGRAFGAWVDLREGPAFGAVHTETLDEATAVFVPRGVGNAYQTLVPDTVYSYLVNAHWSAEAEYTHLNLADPTAAVPWPIPLRDAVISDKDRVHPELTALAPVTGSETVILGAGGQVGRALAQALPHARAVHRDEFDVADPGAIGRFDFEGVGTLLNATAYTAVDAAETDAAAAWATNATAVGALALAARQHRFTLVHYSTDYAFDGTGGSGPHGAYRESDPVAPLGVYGQSKAAGELAVANLERHCLIRTSWVIGDGHNFVATMRKLARSGVEPRVVDDQIGRLTFASELARATQHLLAVDADPGTYHVTGGGRPASWADVAAWVFAAEGRDPRDVIPVSTAEYLRDQGRPVAPRPMSSVLNLDRLGATGFTPTDHERGLREYLAASAQATPPGS